MTSSPDLACAHITMAFASFESCTAYHRASPANIQALEWRRRTQSMLLELEDKLMETTFQSSIDSIAQKIFS